MSTLKEEREAISRDIHIKYLAKAKTAKIDGSELTVLPYGYLSQAVKEALLSHEEKVIERVRKEIERILAIQNSGVRPDSEFEKGYTTAFEYMRHLTNNLK